MTINKFLWIILSRLIPKQTHKVPAALMERILVMRYGFLGDVLQTTPVLNALHRAWPNAQIDYWVSDSAAPALSNNPNLSRIVSADSNGPLNLKKPIALIRHALLLRKGRYDLGISLGPDPLYGFLAWLAGIKSRAGLIVDKRKAAFLNVWLETPFPERVSRQRRYLELLEQPHVRVSARDHKIEMFWSPQEDQGAEELLCGQTGNLVALFCGTGPLRFRPWAKRKWRVGSWKSLAARIIRDNSDLKILLIGSEQEAKVNCDIASILPEDRLVDLTGKTSFSQLGPVLKRCKLLVSNDSAPVFVAAAVDCPTVVIYGPEWPERASPLTDHWYPVFVELPCRDYCASFPATAPECNNECMSLVTVEMVMSKIDKVMKNEKSRLGG